MQPKIDNRKPAAALAAALSCPLKENPSWTADILIACLCFRELGQGPRARAVPPGNALVRPGALLKKADPR
jgi:hypothetical protein